ncbi:MAG: CrcB family protein [Bacteroidales bacterium]|nr:CrcB family protein [Bacteroidales bacterium]
MGGFAGSALRYMVTLLMARLELSSWVATLTVNSLGSLIIGILSVCFGGSWNLLLAVGLCGGFTTFSSFSLQTVQMLQNGEYLLAAANIALSVVICLLFCWLGVFVGGKIN